MHTKYSVASSGYSIDPADLVFLHLKLSEDICLRSNNQYVPVQGCRTCLLCWMDLLRVPIYRISRLLFFGICKCFWLSLSRMYLGNCFAAFLHPPSPSLFVFLTSPSLLPSLFLFPLSSFTKNANALGDTLQKEQLAYC